MFLFSQPMRTRNVLSNFFQPLFTSSSCRIVMCFLIGLSAAPLGLIFFFIFTCAVILTSLFLPVLFGPLCFAVYVTFFAYMVWTTMGALRELVRSFTASIRQSYTSCMGWIYKNTPRIPLSRLSTSSMPNQRDVPGDDQSGNSKNVQPFRESLSVDANKDTEQADVRQLNVRSVSINKIQTLVVSTYKKSASFSLHFTTFSL